MTKQGVTKIDIKQVLAQKAPKASRKIPGFIVDYLIRTVHQEELNDILTRYHDKEGVDFMRELIGYFDLTLNLVHEENIPTEGRYIFASNHPLGGVDGVALGAIIGRHYDGRFRYLVNDLLMNLPGLAPLCIPINKTGKQSRSFPEMVEAGFSGDNHILMFPAGICSRKIDGQIHDLPWKKTFITKSVETKRDIVPIHFGGRNSDFFYGLANVCKALHIKFNIAMLFLVDEMYKNVHKSFRVAIGKPIPWQTFDKSKTAMEWAKYVQDMVYRL